LSYFFGGGEREGVNFYEVTVFLFCGDIPAGPLVWWVSFQEGFFGAVEDFLGVRGGEGGRIFELGVEREA
jgi:hypothetical protein